MYLSALLCDALCEFLNQTIAIIQILQAGKKTRCNIYGIVEKNPEF
jgi:hypothetical protein